MHVHERGARKLALRATLRAMSYRSVSIRMLHASIGRMLMHNELIWVEDMRSCDYSLAAAGAMLICICAWVSNDQPQNQDCRLKTSVGDACGMWHMAFGMCRVAWSVTWHVTCDVRCVM